MFLRRRIDDEDKKKEKKSLMAKQVRDTPGERGSHGN